MSGDSSKKEPLDEKSINESIKIRDAVLENL